MGAALGNQYRITVLQLVKLSGPVHSFLQITLVACKEDGEGGERYIRRGICVYFLEGLGISDNQSWFLAKSPQGLRKLGFSGDYRDSAGFQHITDGLLLGQDQASLWCSGINRNHQHHHIFRLDQVGHNALFIRFGGRGLDQCANPLLELIDLNAVLCADADFMFLQDRWSGEQVGFVVYGNMRNFLLLKEF